MYVFVVKERCFFRSRSNNQPDQENEKGKFKREGRGGVLERDSLEREGVNGLFFVFILT